MAIENLIACLYPVDDNAGNALCTVNKPENKSFFLEPMGEDRSRAASEATEDDGQYCNSNEDDKSTDDEGANEEPEELSKEQDTFYTPGLCLRFNDYRKNRIGIVFGTSQQADIVLPRRRSLPGLAKIVCAITFDDLGRLVLKDLQDKGSKGCGTSVTYSGECGQKRQGFTWILSGDTFTKEHRHIVIALHDRLKFRIVVAEHDIHTSEYQEQIALFRGRLTISADDLTFDGLDVQSTSTTAVPSGAQTPSIGISVDQSHTTLRVMQPPDKKAILLNGGELGRGGQAIVSRLWDVSTGLEYAAKSAREPKFCHLLAVEISLLKQLSHNHIVNMIGSWTAVPPQMLLEYIPLGTLKTQHQEQAISGKEALDILCQCLSALQYIHEFESPIIHRDIKPSNILIQSRDPFHVKISDFGYSRSGSKLMTICGTPIYAAPEIPLNECYTAAVDIWSLGVVVFEYTHQLPPVTRPKDWYTINWTNKIVNSLSTKAQNSSCPLLHFLSTAMLILAPQKRHSARACLNRALGLRTSQCCGHSSLGARKDDLQLRALSKKVEEDESATNRFSTEIQEDGSPTNRCSTDTRCEHELPDTLPPNPSTSATPDKDNYRTIQVPADKTPQFRLRYGPSQSCGPVMTTIEGGYLAANQPTSNGATSRTTVIGKIAYNKERYQSFGTPICNLQESTSATKRKLSGQVCSTRTKRRTSAVEVVNFSKSPRMGCA